MYIVYMIDFLPTQKKIKGCRILYNSSYSLFLYRFSDEYLLKMITLNLWVVDMTENGKFLVSIVYVVHAIVVPTVIPFLLSKNR